MKKTVLFLLIGLCYMGCTSQSNDVSKEKGSDDASVGIMKPEDVTFSHEVIKDGEEFDFYEIDVSVLIDGKEYQVSKENTPGLSLDELLATEVEFEHVLATASTWWAGGGSNYFAIWDEENKDVIIKREIQDEGMDPDGPPMIEELKVISLD